MQVDANIERPFLYYPERTGSSTKPFSILIPAGNDPLHYAYNIYRFEIPDDYFPALAKIGIENVPPEFGIFEFSGILAIRCVSDDWDEARNPDDPKRPELVMNTCHVFLETGKRVSYVKVHNDKKEHSGVKITSVCIELTELTPPAEI
jgi:hypothetical protein